MLASLADGEVLALPWSALLGFVRISTNPRVFTSPLSADQALLLVERWLSHASIVIAHPTARHVGVLAGLLRSSGTAGNLTTDAHIAALAIENGAAVATFDRDFERFGVPVVVPHA